VPPRGHTVATATHNAKKMMTTCPPMIEQPSDTPIAASSDKERLQQPIQT